MLLPFANAALVPNEWSEVATVANRLNLMWYARAFMKPHIEIENDPVCVEQDRGTHPDESPRKRTALNHRFVHLQKNLVLNVSYRC
jgi:hypothetical protein